MLFSWMNGVCFSSALEQKVFYAFSFHYFFLLNKLCLSFNLAKKLNYEESELRVQRQAVSISH